MMMMIVIYFIITVVNWAFHYYCYYYIIFLSLLNIQYFCCCCCCKSLVHHTYCIYSCILFQTKTQQKKSILHGYWKESSEAGRVHDNYMGYEYSSFIFTRSILRAICCFFLFSLSSWLPSKCSGAFNVCAFLCEKIAERKGRQYLQFFLISLYLEYLYTGVYLGNCIDDQTWSFHIIIFFLCVFIIVILKLFFFPFFSYGLFWP